MAAQFTAMMHLKKMTSVALSRMNWNEGACTKWCPVCMEDCNKYLQCSNHTDHIICSDCAENVVENSKFRNPDDSINAIWNCPLCRHENDIGCWQFLPKHGEVEAPPQDDTRTNENNGITVDERANFVAEINELKELHNNRVESMERNRREMERLLVNKKNIYKDQMILKDQLLKFSNIDLEKERELRVKNESEVSYYKQLMKQRDNDFTDLQKKYKELLNKKEEGSKPPKDSEDVINTRYIWIQGLQWKKSKVNQFKAWVMYHDHTYGPNSIDSISAGNLKELKRHHNYEELKDSRDAPWYDFLDL